MEPVRTHPATIGIIGAGRVGTSLGTAWTRAGHRVRFVSRERHPKELDVLILAVPDGAVAEVAAEVAGQSSARVAAHVSGSLDLEVLAPLRSPHTHVGSLHPLLAISRRRTPLEGSWAAIDGDATARRVLRQLARAAGLHVLATAPHDRTLYHLGAALAANSLAPLLAAATTLFVEAGIPEAEASSALAALMASAVASIASSGAAEGLTGAIARGDLETVRRHLRPLSRKRERGGVRDPPHADPHAAARQLYLAASLAAVELARSRRPRPPNLDAIAALLRRS